MSLRLFLPLILVSAAGGFAAGRLAAAWQERGGGWGAPAGLVRSAALKKVLRAQEQGDATAFGLALEELRAAASDPSAELPTEARLCQLLMADDRTGLAALARQSVRASISARASLYLIRRVDDAQRRLLGQTAFLKRHPASWLRVTWSTEAGR